MADEESAAVRIEELEREIIERKQQLAALYLGQEPEIVGEYEFQRSDGKRVALLDLFDGQEDLILIHNMGSQCRYCTAWADGFNGVLRHIESRASFVVCSPDAPETQRKIAESRGWEFTIVSPLGPGFTTDMGFVDAIHIPGFSTFHKDESETIRRIANRKFGAHDDFFPPWHFFDLLRDGPGDWKPKFQY